MLFFKTSDYCDGKDTVSVYFSLVKYAFCRTPHMLIFRQKYETMSDFCI